MPAYIEVGPIPTSIWSERRKINRGVIKMTLQVGRTGKVMLMATLAMLAIIVLLSFASTDAEAATITVNVGDSIQDAIDDANPGDTILVEHGEFIVDFYAENLVVDKDLTIRGTEGAEIMPGFNEMPFLAGNNPGEPLIAFTGNELVLENFILANGFFAFGPGLTIIGDDATVEVNRCIFVANEGAIYGRTTGTLELTVTDSWFGDNYCPGDSYGPGGAIRIHGGYPTTGIANLVVDGCLFEGNNGGDIRMGWLGDTSLWSGDVGQWTLNEANIWLYDTNFEFWEYGGMLRLNARNEVNVYGERVHFRKGYESESDCGSNQIGFTSDNLGGLDYRTKVLTWEFYDTIIDQYDDGGWRWNAMDSVTFYNERCTFYKEE
ncbi:MAG: hypothetical protein QCI38_08660, partial [Candidatus Thermoplasmatota archaeon]|nr:hypothetical protein [Candidatus Thermoplasmatota archaeon]